MIRIEVKTHEETFELLKIFEKWQENEIETCLKENNDYFLRVVETGHPRQVIWTNF